MVEQLAQIKTLKGSNDHLSAKNRFYVLESEKLKRNFKNQTNLIETLKTDKTRLEKELFKYTFLPIKSNILEAEIH